MTMALEWENGQIKRGWENGQLVPVVALSNASEDYQQLRLAVHELKSGTSDLFAALSSLKQLARDCVPRTMPIPTGWGQLWLGSSELTKQHARWLDWIPWVVSGAPEDHQQLVSVAKQICVQTRGNMVMVILRESSRRVVRRDVLLGDKTRATYRYRGMLVAPRPVRIKTKNGKRYLDWKPVVVEPHRRDERYGVLFDEPTAKSEIAVFRKMVRAQATALMRIIPVWQVQFRVEY